MKVRLGWHIYCVRTDHRLRTRSTGDFYQRFFAVGVIGAHIFGEEAEGFSTTGAGSSLRASRTDSVNRGSSISLFTLASVVLALRRVFFFCILYAGMDRSQNLFSIAHTAIFGRIRDPCPGSPRYTFDHLACNHSRKPCLFPPRL